MVSMIRINKLELPSETSGLGVVSPFAGPAVLALLTGDS